MVRPALVDRLALLLGAVLLIGGVGMTHGPAPAAAVAGALLIGGVIWRKA